MAVELLVVRERSLAEAAAGTGRSKVSLKVNLHRAIGTLRRLLSGSEDGEALGQFSIDDAADGSQLSRLNSADLRISVSRSSVRARSGQGNRATARGGPESQLGEAL
ncbi:hypothetical protein ACRAWG_19125 [Methylobacterium sp. P31]